MLMQNIELSTPKELTNVILNAVLDNEAEALIESLCSTEKLRFFQEDFTPQLQASGTKYVRTLLSDSIDSGDAIVIIATSGDTFIGYALLFKLDGENRSRHLHRIFVFDEYKGRGVGTEILNILRTQYAPFTFLSKAEDVAFYQKNGFHQRGRHILPETGEFVLSSDTYGDLISMGSEADIEQATAFSLNDSDIVAIAGLSK